MKKREPLKCEICGEPWEVTRTQSGQIAVRPDSWWQPVEETWSATCGCLVGMPARGLARAQRTFTAPTEGELYRALGYLYA